MENITITPMAEADTDEAVELIALAMNGEEAQWALETMRFHFACLRQRIDSGRDYYVWRHDNTIQGLVGLHRYAWGPKQNVWLSWFAVHPVHQGTGVGSALLSEAEARATAAGYEKLFIETYGSKTFESARSFYESRGFSLAGKIDNYLPDNSAMLVYYKEL